MVIGFHEKIDKPTGNQPTRAVYIISKELLDRTVTDLQRVKDFSMEVLNRFVGYINSYEKSELIFDVGTSEDYEKVNN